MVLARCRANHSLTNPSADESETFEQLKSRVMVALGIPADMAGAVRLSRVSGYAVAADDAVGTGRDGVKATLSFADAAEQDAWRAALSVDDLMFIHVFRRACDSPVRYTASTNADILLCTLPQLRKPQACALLLDGQ